MDQTRMDSDCVLDPITALHLTQGRMAGKSSELVERLLAFWLELARPQCYVPANAPSFRDDHGIVRMKSIIAWALWVKARGYLADLKVAGGQGIQLTHFDDTTDHYVGFLIRNPNRDAIEELEIEWAHVGRPGTRLQRIVAEHRDAIRAWTDPTPLELETFTIEPVADTCPSFPYDFGVGDEGQWNLFGIEWPHDRGGILRIGGGRWLSCTVPCVVAQDARRAAALALQESWKITRLSVPAKP
jgi:hypothetical protein